ncbi:hypothetical protein NHX12_025042 [Muraenolepis orangiensis]|uniref:rRNA methyltransferase 1, mitochondrial n=1 Tax=Muraenolepis orangiensis TaxID=630683 RepID=A0A9Q0ISZ6_9TELE|nr:hypothetical protein NHX12_025042 [Muraenolepis orangiensis]
MALWNIAWPQRLLFSKFHCDLLRSTLGKREAIGGRRALHHLPSNPVGSTAKPAGTRNHLGRETSVSKGSQDWSEGPSQHHHQHRAQNKAIKNGNPLQRRPKEDLYKIGFEDLGADSEKPVRGNVSREPKDDRHVEVVFGISPCLLALTNGRRKPFKLLVKEGEASASVIKVCEEAHSRGVRIKRVSRKHLDRVSTGRVHQGVCLQASPLSYLSEETAAFTSVVKRSDVVPLWLVLDGIQDPMNLGAVLRSAYFLGVDRVTTGLHNCCPLTPVVSKASSGAMEVMDVYGYESLEEMLRLKVSQGWHVVGTVGAQTEEGCSTVVTRCSDFQMTKPTLLLMGGEGEGVSKELFSLCQTFLTIPPFRQLIPGIESLNVSVATGILLHSLLSHRTPERTGS